MDAVCAVAYAPPDGLEPVVIHTGLTPPDGLQPVSLSHAVVDRACEHHIAMWKPCALAR